MWTLDKKVMLNVCSAAADESQANHQIALEKLHELVTLGVSTAQPLITNPTEKTDIQHLDLSDFLQSELNKLKNKSSDYGRILTLGLSRYQNNDFTIIAPDTTKSSATSEKDYSKPASPADFAFNWVSCDAAKTLLKRFNSALKPEKNSSDGIDRIRDLIAQMSDLLLGPRKNKQTINQEEMSLVRQLLKEIFVEATFRISYKGVFGNREATGREPFYQKIINIVANDPENINRITIISKAEAANKELAKLAETATEYTLSYTSFNDLFNGANLEDSTGALARQLHTIATLGIKLDQLLPPRTKSYSDSPADQYLMLWQRHASPQITAPKKTIFGSILKEDEKTINPSMPLPTSLFDFGYLTPELTQSILDAIKSIPQDHLGSSTGINTINQCVKKMTEALRDNNLAKAHEQLVELFNEAAYRLTYKGWRDKEDHRPEARNHFYQAVINTVAGRKVTVQPSALVVSNSRDSFMPSPAALRAGETATTEAAAPRLTLNGDQAQKLI